MHPACSKLPLPEAGRQQLQPQAFAHHARVRFSPDGTSCTPARLWEQPRGGGSRRKQCPGVVLQPRSRSGSSVQAAVAGPAS